MPKQTPKKSIAPLTSKEKSATSLEWTLAPLQNHRAAWTSLRKLAEKNSRMRLAQRALLRLMAVMEPQKYTEPEDCLHCGSAPEDSTRCVVCGKPGPGVTMIPTYRQRLEAIPAQDALVEDRHCARVAALLQHIRQQDAALASLYSQLAQAHAAYPPALRAVAAMAESVQNNCPEGSRAQYASWGALAAALEAVTTDLEDDLEPEPKEKAIPAGEDDLDGCA